MNKKEYILNQFKRTFNKKYENYCITRIYTLLNRNDIQIITQQMFKRGNDCIALADLYFPQINLYVEIDESHHKNQQIADLKRKNEVEQNKKIIDEKLKNLGEVIVYPLEEKRIDVTVSLEEINTQIDNVVEEINKKIQQLGNRFSPWECRTPAPQDYIKLGVINTSKNVRLRTIKEVSDLFNKGYSGYQRAVFSVQGDYTVWCPKLKIYNKDCQSIKYDNEISNDGRFIFETAKYNPNFYQTASDTEKRIVFAKYKDEADCYMYKFRGVFKINREKSNKERKAVWEKFSDSYNISKLF